MKHVYQMELQGSYSNWNIPLTLLHKSEVGEFSRLQNDQKYKDIKHTLLERTRSGSHSQKKLDDQDLLDRSAHVCQNAKMYSNCFCRANMHMVFVFYFVSLFLHSCINREWKRFRSWSL